MWNVRNGFSALNVTQGKTDNNTSGEVNPKGNSLSYKHTEKQ